jgi:hypothetical protein
MLFERLDFRVALSSGKLERFVSVLFRATPPRLAFVESALYLDGSSSIPSSIDHADEGPSETAQHQLFEQHPHVAVVFVVSVP